MVARDQMVGPGWQSRWPTARPPLPARSYYGEAMSIGERAPVAPLTFAASARLAVGEALTNIAATQIGDIVYRFPLTDGRQPVIPAKMLASGDAVKAVERKLCPQLGLIDSAGKDSMSMKPAGSSWATNSANDSPLSLVISAFACVEDVRHTYAAASGRKITPCC